MRERHCSEWSTACLRPAVACAHPGQLSVKPNYSKSVRRNGARRTCRHSGTNGGSEIAAYGCNTSALIPALPPSSSSALGVNSLHCVSSNKLPVHRSPGKNHLIVRAFTTVPTTKALCLIQPSVPSTFLARIVNPKGPNDGWKAAKAATTLAHRTVPRGNSAPSHISFVCCLAVSTYRKPTMHAGGIRHKPRQQIMVCSHLNTRS